MLVNRLGDRGEDTAVHQAPWLMVLGTDLEPASHAIPTRLLEMQPEQAHERALAFQLRRGAGRC